MGRTTERVGGRKGSDVDVALSATNMNGAVRDRISAIRTLDMRGAAVLNFMRNDPDEPKSIRHAADSRFGALVLEARPKSSRKLVGV